MPKGKLEVVNDVRVRKAENGLVLDKSGHDSQGNWADSVSVLSGKEARKVASLLGLDKPNEMSNKQLFDATFRK